MTGKQKWLVGGAVATVLVASAVLILIPRKAPSFEKDSLLKEIQSTVKKPQAKIEEADFADLEGIVSQLKSGPAKALVSQLSPETQALLESFQPSQISPELQQSLLKDLNTAMEDANFYGGLKEAGEKSGKDIEGKLRQETRDKNTRDKGQGEGVREFNRSVLKDIYPKAHQMLQNPEPVAVRESLKEIEQDPTQYLHQRLSNETQKLAEAAFIPKEISEKLKQQLARDLNQAIERPDFYAALEEEAKKQGEDLEKRLSEQTKGQGSSSKGQGLGGLETRDSKPETRDKEDILELNRRVVEDLFGEKIQRSADQQKAIAKAATDTTAKTKTDQRDERTKGTNKPAVHPPETEPPTEGKTPAPGEYNSLPGTPPVKYDSKGNAYVPGEIIIKILDQVNIDNFIQRLKGEVNIINAESVFPSIEDPELRRYYRVEVDRGEDIEKLARVITEGKLAEVAEPNYYFHVEKVPNDSLFYRKTQFDDSGLWGLVKIHAPEAWEKITGSENMVVGVVDSGIDYNHPDLKMNVYANSKEIPDNGIDDDGNGFKDDVRGWDFFDHFEINANGNARIIEDKDVMDTIGHGTHVSGTIGAVGNNGEGITGVAWQIKILPVKVFDKNGNGNAIVFAKAVAYAAKMGARVINCSFGGPQSDALKGAMKYGYDRNCVIVVSAGNNHKDVSTAFPASLPWVITVAATDRDDRKARFTNIGTQVDLAAPGFDIVSTVPLSFTNTSGGFYDFFETPSGGKYMAMDGTSMAAPHVSGSAALIIAYYERSGKVLSNEQVRQILRVTADKPQPWQRNPFKYYDENIPWEDDWQNDNDWKVELGGGRLNLEKALSFRPDQIPPVAAIHFVILPQGSPVLKVYGVAYSSSEKGLATVTLEMAKQSERDTWKTLSSSVGNIKTTQLIGGGDLSQLEGGDYILRLKVIDENGQTAEDFANFKVPNLYLSQPANFQTYRKGEIIKINGTVDIKNLDHFDFSYQKWEFDYTPPHAQAKWPEPNECPFPSSKVGITLGGNGGKEAVRDGLLAEIDTSRILEESRYRLIGFAYDKKGEKYRIKTDFSPDPEGAFFFIIDSTTLPGWPVKAADPMNIDGSFAYFPYPSGVAIGEIDKTRSGLETVLPNPIGGGANTVLSVVDDHGTVLPGWPLTGIGEGVDGTPLLKDLNGDGEDEVIFVTRKNSGFIPTSTIHIYQKSGVPFGTWPLPLNYQADITLVQNNSEIQILVIKRSLSQGSGTPSLRSEAEGALYSIDKQLVKQYGKLFSTKTFAVDLDGDGNQELVSSVGNGLLTAGLVVYDLTGNIFSPKWPFIMEPYKDLSLHHRLAAFADINRDGMKEIIVHSSGSLNKTGDLIFRFDPQRGVGVALGSPAVGDLDGNEFLKIVLAYESFVKIFSADGKEIQSQGVKNPLIVKNSKAFSTQPILADVNNDERSDIIVADRERIYAWNGNGESLAGFPKVCPTEPFALAVTDLNMDGRSDLVAYSPGGYLFGPTGNRLGSRGPITYAWDLGVTHRPEVNEWPFPYHDVEQTCIYAPLKEGIKRSRSAGLTVQFYAPQILSFTDPNAAEYSYGFGLLKKEIEQKESNWDVNNDWEKRDWLKDASGTYVWTKLTQINTETRYGYIDIAAKDAEGEISATYRYRFAPRGELNKDPHHALPGEPPLLNHPDFDKKPVEPVKPEPGTVCGKLKEYVTQLQNESLSVAARTNAANEISRIPVNDLKQCALYNEAVAALVALLKTPQAAGGSDCERLTRLVDQIRSIQTDYPARLKAIEELGQLGASARQCPNYGAAVAILLDLLATDQRLQKLDLNGDGILDMGDLDIIKRNFGTSGPEGDVDGNGVVDIADLVLVSRAIEQGVIPETGRKMNARAALPEAPAATCDQLSQQIQEIKNAELSMAERVSAAHEIQRMGSAARGCSSYPETVGALMNLLTASSVMEEGASQNGAQTECGQISSWVAKISDSEAPVAERIEAARRIQEMGRQITSCPHYQGAIQALTEVLKPTTRN